MVKDGHKAYCENCRKRQRYYILGWRFATFAKCLVCGSRRINVRGLHGPASNTY